CQRAGIPCIALKGQQPVALHQLRGVTTHPSHLVPAGQCLVEDAAADIAGGPDDEDLHARNSCCRRERLHHIGTRLFTGSPGAAWITSQCSTILPSFTRNRSMNTSVGCCGSVICWWMKTN